MIKKGKIYRVDATTENVLYFLVTNCQEGYPDILPLFTNKKENATQLKIQVRLTNI